MQENNNKMIHNTECPFCLDGFEDDDMRVLLSSECGHISHMKCFREFQDSIKENMKMRCPLCRSLHENDSDGWSLNTEQK
jgi:hypothetical protein